MNSYSFSPEDGCFMVRAAFQMDAWQCEYLILVECDWLYNMADGLHTNVLASASHLLHQPESQTV